VLAPPLDGRDLRATGEESRTKRIWTIADVASTVVSGFGFFRPGGDEDEDGRQAGATSARASSRAIVPGIALRALEGQRLQTIELTGDDRFLPIEELDTRVDRLCAAHVTDRSPR
jgi:hypothetical protein